LLILSYLSQDFYTCNAEIWLQENGPRNTSVTKFPQNRWMDCSCTACQYCIALVAMHSDFFIRMLWCALCVIVYLYCLCSQSSLNL